MYHSCTRIPRLLAGLFLAGTMASPVLADEAHKGHAEPAPAPKPAADLPEPKPAALGLTDLEQLALQRNPTLAQAKAQIDISRAKALQAGLYPNPSIAYQAELIGVPDETGRRTPGEFQGGWLRQEIVTAGKLRLSRAKYKQEAYAAELQALAQQYRVLNGIHIAFYEVLAAQHLIEVHRTLADNARDAVKTTEQMLNVGQANEMDLLQAQVEANREKVALQTAEERYIRNWEHLITLAGAPELPPSPLAGQLEADDPPLEWEKELGRLLEESPELQFAQAEVVRDQITVKREKVEPIPNVVVQGGPGYDYETTPRSTNWNAQVALRVPLFDRNQGTIRQAQADLARAQANVTRVELLLRQRLADAFFRYRMASNSARDYRDDSLPKARKAYELYLDFFKKRRATWPQVLVAERTYEQLSDDYVTTLLVLRRAQVEICGLLLVDGLSAPPGPTPQGHIDAVPKPR